MEDTNPYKNNFNNCLIFVKRKFPNEPEEIQDKMAQAVYEISNVMFNEIIPTIVSSKIRPSQN